MNELFVQDPFNPGDPHDPRKPYLQEVPLLHTFEDITKHFALVTIDQRFGWDATPAGQACWKIVGFHVTVGNTEITPKVLDQNRIYIREKKVNWHFPGIHGGPGHPAYFPQCFSVKTKWEGNGAHFGVNGDHNVEPGVSGPDSIWVETEPGKAQLSDDPNFSTWITGAGGPEYSDAVHGLGMRGHTNHLIVSPIFQYVVKDGGGVIQTGILEQALIDSGTPKIMPLNPNAALYKTAQEAELGQRLTLEYEVEFGGQTYVAQIYERGLVYALKGDWGHVKMIQGGFNV